MGVRGLTRQAMDPELPSRLRRKAFFYLIGRTPPIYIPDAFAYLRFAAGDFRHDDDALARAASLVRRQHLAWDHLGPVPIRDPRLPVRSIWRGKAREVSKFTLQQRLLPHAEDDRRYVVLPDALRSVIEAAVAGGPEVDGFDEIRERVAVRLTGGLSQALERGTVAQFRSDYQLGIIVDHLDILTSDAFE